MTTSWLKSAHHSLHFLKSESRAKERCRSLVFFQTKCNRICWKVMREFLLNDTKDKLSTPALNLTSDMFPDTISLAARTCLNLASSVWPSEDFLLFFIIGIFPAAAPITHSPEGRWTPFKLVLLWFPLKSPKLFVRAFDRVESGNVAVLSPVRF